MTKEQLSFRQKVKITGLASEVYGTVIGWADYGDALVEAEVVLVTGLRRGDVATIGIDHLHEIHAIPHC